MDSNKGVCSTAIAVQLIVTVTDEFIPILT